LKGAITDRARKSSTKTSTFLVAEDGQSTPKLEVYIRYRGDSTNFPRRGEGRRVGRKEQTDQSIPAWGGIALVIYSGSLRKTKYWEGFGGGIASGGGGNSVDQIARIRNARKEKSCGVSSPSEN